MMDILDLSYKHLPRHLKACFLYLGNYPEDHIIKKAELVSRWVAECFVSASRQQNVWDVAEIYLNELVKRSMIQHVHRDEGFVVFSGYRVHDMMLDLILRKCEEDNFLSIINGPQALVAMKEKVVRRFTVHQTDTDQGGPMLMTTATGNLSHVRSVTVFSGSCWSMPLLLELKFVRVLELSSVNYSSTRVDICGIINRLSYLRYLKVRDGYNMALPANIGGLRQLETLDLSKLSIDTNSLDLVDVPRLSHLSMPRGTRLPCGIAEMKQLRTLRGIDLSWRSSESIEGLGELTGLSELSIFLKRPPTATWMAALCTCLEKLGKLRLLEVFGETLHSAGPLSSLSPPFGNSLERLRLGAWTFTNVPRWVGHLQCLQHLQLCAKQIFQEDVAIIGMLPNLIRLWLRIVHVPTTRIVIGGGGGFTLVNWFMFDCDGISSLTFEAGVMPSLRVLRLAFDIHHWDRAAPVGLQHLSCLKQIHLHKATKTTSSVAPKIDDEADTAVLSVFQETVDAFLTRPELTYRGNVGILRRLLEEEVES